MQRLGVIKSDTPTRTGGEPGLEALRRGLAALQTQQRVFWAAAAEQPAFADADSFAEPDWQCFQAFWEHLPAARSGEDAPGPLSEVTGRYHRLVGEAWARVQAQFETHRRALVQAGPDATDWRVLRQRWFDFAETEFIELQRSPAFLDAQRDALGVLAGMQRDLPADVRAATAQHSRALASVGQTLARQDWGAVEIAQTPKREIWRHGDGKITLWHYTPLAERRAQTPPLLICHGLIGRQTMTDLLPERSLVRNLLAAGVEVYAVDWGDAGPEDRDKGFDHYAGDCLDEAIAAVCDASGQPRIALLGICQGGTMALCRAAAGDPRLAALAVAVTPVDFHADTTDADPAHGLLNVWVRAQGRADLDGLIGPDGNLSGALTGLVFNQLNPVRTLAKYAIEMLDCAENPAPFRTFLAMERWLADRPDLPGAVARAWLGDLYHANALVAGTFRFREEPVDLTQISVPVLNIFATGDHIIPPPCSRALGRYLDPSRYRELALPTGHIGAFVSARAQTRLAPALVTWLDEIPTVNRQ